MSNYDKAINVLNRRFVYVSDSSLYGVGDAWKDFTGTSRYKRIKGDCEDYAIALWRQIEGCEIWFCHAWGGGHAVVKLPDGKWIDCNDKKPMEDIPSAWNFSVAYQFRDATIKARLDDAKLLLPIKSKRLSEYAVRVWLNDLFFRIKINIIEFFKGDV